MEIMCIHEMCLDHLLDNNLCCLDRELYACSIYDAHMNVYVCIYVCDAMYAV